MFKCLRLYRSLNLHRCIHGNAERNTGSCNDSFFSEWSPSMTYWLGFLYADGNVCHYRVGYTISISLQCADHSHVRRFRDAVQSTYHLGLNKPSRNAFGTKCLAVTQIRSDKMASDLIKLGCVPNKLLILEWNDYVPRSLMHHFVRGYFDGDGCIFFYKTKAEMRVSFCGTSMFMTGLFNYIKDNVLHDHKANGCMYHRKNSTLTELSYAGRHSAMAVLNWMYRDSANEMRLTRKYQYYELFQRLCALKGDNMRTKFEEFITSEDWHEIKSCNHQDLCPQIHKIPHAKIRKRLVAQLTLEGEVVKIWDRPALVQKELGFNAAHIYTSSKYPSRSAYGYRWKFVDS